MEEGDAAEQSAGSVVTARPAASVDARNPLSRPLKRAALQPSERAWVVGTISLITILVFTSQLVIIIPHFLSELPMRRGDAVRSLITILGPFNLGALGIYWNYVNCVTMDPGGVPHGWKPPAEVIKATSGAAAGGGEGAAHRGQVRYCKPCRTFKPPRAHHCRTCKRCVLRMDHHCPWVANCVGQRNYASFIRFLACVDVTCAMHLLLLSARVADYWGQRMGYRWRPPGSWTMVFLIINFALCVPTLLLVGVFSLYHFWCLCANTTTIEGWEKDKVDRMVNRGRIRHIHYPFDLGMLRNITSVLGGSPLHWCLPSLTRGDGLRFDVGEGVADVEQYSWPPKDPSRSKEVRGQRRPDLSGDPFTYGKGQLNPALTRGSGSLRKRNNVHRLPPWHPNFGRQHEADDVDDDDHDAEPDTAEQAGVDTGEGCMPPLDGGDANDGYACTIDEGEEDDDDDEVDNDASESEEEQAGRGKASTLSKSRVRRGSEGYEVRPKRYDVAYAEAEEEDEALQGDYMDDDAVSNSSDRSSLLIGPNADEDEKAWLWRERQREEEAMRQQIQAQWRADLRNGQPSHAWTAQATELERTGVEGNVGGPVLLPSEVMQRRITWQQLHNRPRSEDGEDV